LKRIDESPLLTRLLQRVSDMLARQRGLPIVLGIVLIIASLIVQAINVFAGNTWLQMAGIVLLHVGVLTALIGLLLATPLGK
jgi:uncharacterized membrane protein HdeD (DUF308 family)